MTDGQQYLEAGRLCPADRLNNKPSRLQNSNEPDQFNISTHIQITKAEGRLTRPSAVLRATAGSNRATHVFRDHPPADPADPDHHHRRLLCALGPS
ncbi:MAG: hypothetical protein MZU91_01975 [Desulfosudis oleivorans]|nr:hypothetical protein [Desulfosudis oleivorans]